MRAFRELGGYNTSEIARRFHRKRDTVQQGADDQPSGLTRTTCPGWSYHARSFNSSKIVVAPYKLASLITE